MLELTLPRPPQPELGSLTSGAMARGRAPGFEVPPGPPDLLETVQLPEAVDPFPGHAAQPFGGVPPQAPDHPAHVAPEPSTGLLLLLGLFGLWHLGRARA